VLSFSLFLLWVKIIAIDKPSVKMVATTAMMPKSNPIDWLSMFCCWGYWLVSFVFAGGEVGLDGVLVGVGLVVGCTGLGVEVGVGDGCLF